MPPSASSAPDTAIMRCLRVLDCLGATPGPHTPTTIGATTGLPPATVHRILATLVEWGGVERIGRGRYRLGLHMWRLGAAVPSARVLRDLALPYLEDLYEATHLVVHMAVPDGDEVLYLEKITARRSVRVTSGVGRRLPMHATGPGKVLLAFGDPSLLERVVENGLPRLTPATITSERALRAALADIRRTGVAISREEASAGTASVAAPVFAEGRDAVAALAVVGAADSIDTARLAQPLRTVAHALSRALQARAQVGGLPPASFN
ncbi:helix-turn-helix domain-containing protein [Nocardioides sp. LMS-CY]|uniref:DNA-binding IclR family transcriptional regulator n=1 Tax=Nocardioides soli TaxID=1036020 RepID=A0A7W4VZV9_9ACTN|nr:MULTISPECIES: IclR family transcriptional regulator [Nocardioides]MBB3044760.1 DNA-binding IclR family transcriptional regulator [Nocardioides soli]QWF19985.1 helix-turn-helix domain-containing protein [Nocardioides sp. LMS-CY]